MDPTTAQAYGTPVIARLLEYGALGILIIVLAGLLYLERRRADRLEAEMRQMLREQTPVMTGLIKQGDRIEGALKGVGEAIQSVREAFIALQAQIGRGGQ